MSWWPWSNREGSLNVEQTDFVVFDLETGGLDPTRDDILSIGAVRMRGARIEAGTAFSTLVRPAAGRVSAQSVRVHQLTPARLADEPPVTRALPEFFEFCSGAVLAGWHVELDLAFLRAWAGRLGLKPGPMRSLDVLGLYLGLRGGRASHLLEDLPLKDATLYTVARALGITPRGAHDALGDAYLTAQVLQRFLSILRASRQGEPFTLDAALRMADPRRSQATRAAQPAF